MNRWFVYLLALSGIVLHGACSRSGTDQASAPPSLSESDRWDAELYQDRTAAQLRRVLDTLASSSRNTDNDMALSALLAEGFSSSALRPSDDAAEDTLSQLGGYQIRRWNRDQFGAWNGSGATGLRRAFDELSVRWPKDSKPRLKAKQYNIRRESGQVISNAVVRSYAAGSNRAVQQQSDWVCTWELVSTPDAKPRLISIVVNDLEEVEVPRRAGRPMLEDVTKSLIGDLPCYEDNLRYGANHWILRYPRLKHRFHHGMAVGDVNGDGLEDVYLCQPEGMRNVLLLREQDGSVCEAAAEFGVDFLDNSTSALLIDLDNDGDNDLVIAARLVVVVLENLGDSFAVRFSLPPAGQLFSLASADYDEDGHLDVYVCRYMEFGPDGHAPNPIPLHDANNGGRNVLLRNRGDWSFEDVTDSSGLDANNTRWSVAAAWEDFDNDGDLDLYVANDYGRNCLYRCDRDASGNVTFRDVAPEVGVEDMTTGMSVAWSDVNHDGRMDLYVSNMYSSAGRRITYQKNFKKDVIGVDEQHIRAVQYAALGNSLFVNRSDGTFQHASQIARVRRGLWAWSSNFVDLNNDGWEDLLVANGFLTGPNDTKDL